MEKLRLSNTTLLLVILAVVIVAEILQSWQTYTLTSVLKSGVLVSSSAQGVSSSAQGPSALADLASQVGGCGG